MLARWAAVVAALAVPVLAQAPAAPAAPAGPTFVRLNVLAFDEKGQPVGDLKPGDLQVLDQGKPQRIVYFHRQGFAPAKTAPGEFSNRAASGAHTTAILLDVLNVPRNEALDTIRKLAQGLQQLESGENVYLYALVLDGSLVPIHPMPADPLAPPTPADRTWQRHAQAMIDDAVHLGARKAGLNNEITAKKTYVALETLGRQLAFYSGQRNLIWVMRDVPTVTDAAQAAGLYIDTGDRPGGPQKLTTDSNKRSLRHSWDQPGKTCTGDWLDCALYVQHLTVTMYRTQVPVNLLIYAMVNNVDTNRGLVDTSGMLSGRYFLGEDIGKVLGSLAGQVGGEYVVGYEAPPEMMDNKFHRVKVDSQRAGVKLTVRQRYYAFPDTRPSSARAEEALVASMRGPFDDPQIGMTAKVTPAANAVHLEIGIDPADLMLREEGGAFTGHVTVLLVRYGDGGIVGNPMPGDFNLRLSKEQLAQPLPFVQDVPIDGSVKKVRALIFDHNTNAVGSLTVPVPAAK